VGCEAVKVVLKHTVYDRLYAELEKADAGRKLVDYVVVTQDEYEELKKDWRGADDLSYSYMRYNEMSDPQNATIEFKTFERTVKRDWRESPYIRCVSHEQFRGVPLYVVPKEFHP
jgi:hypothetical protein